jgi:hypothetical protein
MLFYASIGQSAAVSVVALGDKVNRDGSRDLSGVKPISIPPLWGNSGPIPDTPAARSRFICVFFRIADKMGNEIAASVCVTNETTEGDGIWMAKDSGGVEVLYVKTDIIAHLYDEAMKFHAARQSLQARSPENGISD